MELFLIDYNTYIYIIVPDFGLLTSRKLSLAVLRTACLQVIAGSLPGCDADPALISFSCSK